MIAWLPLVGWLVFFNSFEFCFITWFPWFYFLLKNGWKIMKKFRKPKNNISDLVHFLNNFWKCFDWFKNLCYYLIICLMFIFVLIFLWSKKFHKKCFELLKLFRIWFWNLFGVFFFLFLIRRLIWEFYLISFVSQFYFNIFLNPKILKKIT